MSAAKNVLFGNSSLSKIKTGIDTVANAVKETMGPNGRNVVIERAWGSPTITKDGVTVAKEIDLADPEENLGATLVKDAASKTGDESGDGPQPLYSKVLTPSGFVPMGDVKVGDTICGTNNSIQEVLGVYPKGEKEIVKVYFSNGRVVECCEDHVWDVVTHTGVREVVTTGHMIKEMEEGSAVFHTPTFVDQALQADAPTDTYHHGYKHNDKIVGIERTVEKTPMQCIKVSNPDNLYITDGFIVTHNTTTVSVLTQAIFSEGYKLLSAGAKPVELKRGIDKVVKLLVAELRTMSKPISTTEEVAQVGSISANNERELGDLIADAMDKVGKNGVITISEASAEETTLDIEDGFEFDRGWKDTSRHFIDQQKEGVEKISLDNPVILCIGRELSTYTDVTPILEVCVKEGKSLVIIATQFSKIALEFLVYNCRKGIKVYALQAPGFGDNRDAYLEDIAVATGGHVFGIADRSVAALKTPQHLNLLGSATSVVINKASTTILGGKGVAEEIQERIVNLSATAKATASDFDREKIQERVGRLSGGVAVIRVGGNSEVEVKEKRDRVEDALHATRAAISGGVVPGGGVALLNAKRIVGQMDIDYESEDQELGGTLVLRAIEAPIRCIVGNAGGSPDVVVQKILSGEEKGFNAHTGQFEDLIQTGVIDPANVTISALLNSSSIAGMILTTSVSITVIRDAQADPNQGL